MEFKFDKTPQLGKPVAKLFKMSGILTKDSDMALAIYTDDPNKFIWIYSSDGKVTIQGVNPDSRESDPIKTFYKDDEITIKF